MRRAQSSAGTPARKNQPPDPNQSTLFDPDISIKRALILIAGHFDPEHLPKEDCAQAIQKLHDVYSHKPDPGIHALPAWALVCWHAGRNNCERSIPSFHRKEHLDDGRWFVNSVGQTMVAIEAGPLDFLNGLIEQIPSTRMKSSTSGRFLAGLRSPRRKSRSASSTNSWKQYAKEAFPEAQLRPGRQKRPATRGGITWYMAAAYCNWLSRKVNSLNPVYLINDLGQYAEMNAAKLGANRSTEAATGFPPRPSGNTRAVPVRKPAGTTAIRGTS